MIYESVVAEEAIRQGDIFRDIPRVDFSLSRLQLVDDEGTVDTTWKDALSNSDDRESVFAVTLKPVFGIVIAQSCDTARGEYISLCEILPFSSVEKNLPTSAHKWQRLITTKSRENLRYFYLPQDATCGFGDRMAADLRVLIRVLRVDLEEMRPNRVARLNATAAEHFRESIAQFFRRYPYDEWYPLTQSELAAYKEEKGDVEPFSWQVPKT